jgi:hypothetical protein
MRIPHSEWIPDGDLPASINNDKFHFLCRKSCFQHLSAELKGEALGAALGSSESICAHSSSWQGMYASQGKQPKLGFCG